MIRLTRALTTHPPGLWHAFRNRSAARAWSRRLNARSDCALDRPDPALQDKRTIAPAAQEPKPEPGHERVALRLGERPCVGASRSLATQEGTPIVVERGKRQLDVERPLLDAAESGVPPQLTQLPFPAQRHVTLIACGDRGIEGDGFIPEGAQ